jgi:hypothetical protein
VGGGEVTVGVGIGSFEGEQAEIKKRSEKKVRNQTA